MVIVAVSDIHLGYSNSNSKQFEEFLGRIAERTDVSAFVILGDFVDMWRRDVSGLFLQFNGIVQKILAIKEKIPVYCVAGNHDFHLLKLTGSDYPLKFEEKITLQRDGISYRFWHGWEFDSAQQPPIMELLCNNMSDDAGQTRSEAWKVLQDAGKDISNPIKDLFELHNGGKNYLSHLMIPPKDRLSSSSMGDVERKAFASLKEGEVLIFGHTHRPFVDSTRKLVNTGSWISDEETYNTYVEIDGRDIHLMQYNQGDITERFLRIL